MNTRNHIAKFFSVSFPVSPGMRFSTLSGLVLLLVLLAGAGCNTLRRVPEKKKLLVKNKITVDNKNINVSEMTGYLKQKPNRRIFDFGMRGYPLYLHIFNQVDSVRQQRRHDSGMVRMYRRNAKITAKNIKIQAHNSTHKNKRKTKELLTKPRRGLTEATCDWLLKIGERPVLLDSFLMERTVRQLGLYLNNKGYFNSTVTDSVALVPRKRSKVAHALFPKKYPELKYKRKAMVFYTIRAATPYTIRSIRYKSADTLLLYFADTSSAERLLKPGMIYDVDQMHAEADRVALLLRNSGYYAFTRDFVHYFADTTLNSHQMNLTIELRQNYQLMPDSSVKRTNHTRYYVRNIYVVTDYVQREKGDEVARRSFNPPGYDNLYLLFRDNRDSVKKGTETDSLDFRPSTLTERISMQHRQLYSESDYEHTYRELTSLRNFKQVGINMQIAPTRSRDSLDCYIRLLQSKRQSYQLQLEGTNTGGNLGISGSYAYTNINVFRGAEVFELRLRGGTEAQQLVSNLTGGSGDDQLTFNTIEFGPEVSLTFPRAFFPFTVLRPRGFFPFNFVKEDKLSGRRTALQASFNYQRRVDYTRTIGNLAYSYYVKVGNNNRWNINFTEINVVDAVLSENLFEQLVQNNDKLLLYRFTDHLTNDLRIVHTYNNQNQKRQQRNVFFVKTEAEMAGVIPYFIFSRSNATVDNNGSYRINNIPFAHYFRYLIDVRWYLKLGDHQQAVFRIAQGAGLPQKNFSVLPIEKSFFAGGANGVRAWRSRTLGPGSYSDPSGVRYVQFGDILFEYNAELRFRITKTLNGAIFGDGGNIWLIKEDATRPGGTFDFKDAYNDVAFGAGIGLRFDLSFFILRLDAAAPLRDPAFPAGHRWLGKNDGSLKRTNINFGIGYPF